MHRAAGKYRRIGEVGDHLMQRHRRILQAVAVAAVVATVLAACSSSKKPSTPSTTGTSSTAPSATGYNAATTAVANVSTKTGGTLNLAATGDCDSWDPARTYYAWCWNMQRLLTRGLVAYASVPGASATSQIVPDIATSLGVHNATFTQWTYTIKPGILWQNGSPVTSADLKYAIERLYATAVINGGPTFYYLCLLDKCDAKGNPAYAGPYKDKSGLSSILTPNATTITFNLQSPYADFDYLMALPAAAPVPANVEGGTKAFGATYTSHPLSDGPFQISAYTPGKSISFVRNTNWSQATDTIRKPLVDSVNLTINSNADANDQGLKAGTLDAEADGGVQPTFQAQILTDASLKANADDAITGFTRYLVVMPTVAPLTNVHCREAVFYAINKSDLQRARGGSYGGDIANTMTPPVIPGYDSSANPYPDGSGNTGDDVAAKQQLALCGQPNGFTVKEAYTTSGRAPQVFTASQQALAKVGIKVVSAPGDQSSYYSTYIGSPANIVKDGLGIAQAGWGADFPTGYGFWNNIVNGTAILPTGNTNYASLNDPVINGILSSVTKTSGTHDSEFKALDAQVMKDAVMLPYVYDKTLFYRNPAMTNARINFALGGYYDFVNAGVS
jgi:peptide/nickel transport system substrate-binding protein